MKDSRLCGFLADTWWFGLSQRLSEQDFKDLATLRAAQGFSAVQIVIGVPPEIGPENKNAASVAGFPWSLDGHLNLHYLELARDRIQYLNDHGLLVIVYGAWGHQIDWLGADGMLRWWLHIVKALDDLDVVYCLCGESNLWVGESFRLLPDRSTDDLSHRSTLIRLPSRARHVLGAVVHETKRQWRRSQYHKRRNDWSFVLEHVAASTKKPILVHPTANELGCQAVTNPEWLAANTVQTGHSSRARNRLWRLPLTLTKMDCDTQGFINLEPWYEGIKDQFWAEDQLFAYWVSMLAGAMSHCYGAHGIWNVGDGKFLAHWGKQTFAQAGALDTPRLLGLSHRQYLQHRPANGRAFHHTQGNTLIDIGRTSPQGTIRFFPDSGRVDQVANGKIWLPLEGIFSERLPQRGPVVLFHC